MVYTQQVLSVQDAQLTAQWSDFFEHYSKEGILETANDYPDRSSVVVDLRQVELRNPDLSNYTLKRAHQSLRIAKNVLSNFDMPVDPKPRLGIRVRGLPESSQLAVRAIRNGNLGGLHRVDAIIRKATNVKTRFVEAVYECKVCTTRKHEIQEEDQMQEPALCETCDAKRPFRIIEEESRLVNAQRIQLEELTETMEVPSQPQRIQGYVTDDDIIDNEHLLNQVGARVRCTVIVTLLPPKKHLGKTVERDFMLQVMDVEPLDESSARIKLNPEDVEKIEAAAKTPIHLVNLIASLAPGLKGLEVEKEGLWLGIVGGVEKPIDGHHMRGDIHILFCGDPSTGKSKLLHAAQALVPRSVFTDGKGSTAAGLTAAVVKDDFDGQYTLEPGAMPLSDQGICFCDEMDKMDQNDQSSMHSGLEDQEIHINKGGISATLKTRCAVIGASNPKLGRFDLYSPIIEQIDLTPPLLSRFDLIFPMMDKVDKELDQKQARHIAHMHRTGLMSILRRRGRRGEGAPEATPYDVAFLRKFITYVKGNIFPVLSQEAEDELCKYYGHLRNPNVQAMAITKRQYEGLIRLSEASARLFLSNEVRLVDAQRAIRIYEEVMKRVGVDKETGLFNVSLIESGRTQSQTDRIKAILNFVRTAPPIDKYGVAEADIITHMAAAGVSEELTKSTLKTLSRDGALYSPGRHDRYKVM